MAHLPQALALSLFAICLAACDAGALQAPGAASVLAGGAALDVAGRGTLALDAEGHPLMTSPDGSARLELRTGGATRTDVHFLAQTAAERPLTLEWEADRQRVRFVSRAGGEAHDLSLDLRASGALSATLRALNDGRVAAEAVVRASEEVPVGWTVSGPTSFHVWIDEEGRKTIVVDYNRQGTASTGLSSSLLGLREAEVTHVEVALHETAYDREASVGHLSIGGARSVSLLDVQTR